MQAQEKRAKAAKMGPQAASSSAADDNGNEVESDAKRIKTANETPDAEQKTDVVVKKPQKVPRCSICKQYEDQVTFYEGHPTNSVDEFVSLTDDRLMLFTGNEAYIHQEDALPSVKITAFNIYDKHGHLVPIDSGLIERDVLLYVSGYVKPIFDEDDDPETGVPTHDIGPINAWYVSGYDGGERAILLFNSPYADYYMMTPSAAYEPVMRSLNEKIKIAKLVVEFLLDEAWQQPTYEDLLVELACYMNPRINEECLLRHAQFVVDQILSIDQSAADGDAPLIATPCVRTLVKIAGVTFAKRKWMVRVEKGQQRAPAKSSAEFSKATTTPLVRDVMESFFTDQIAIGAEAAGGGGGGNGPKKKRCGVCEACQQADCGKCNYCRDMLKFGGSGKMKQACMQRRCPNMAIQAAEDSDIDDADDADTIILDDTTVPCSRRIVNDVFWTAEPIAQHNGRKYYLSARVGKAQISPGDFVIMNPLEPNHPLIVAEIAYMWEDAEQGPMFHARLFIRGADTILGETSDPREIFVQDICEACPLGAIVRLAVVEKRLPPPNWATNGGTEGLAPLLDDDGQTFFFSKRYDAEHARFVDIDYDEMDENLISTCAACVSRYNKKLFYIPTLNETVITYMGVQYKPGSGVYLNPGTFSFTKVKMEKPEDEKPLKPDYDSELYPEFYRKSNDVKGSNTETGEPFCLGIIEAVWADEEDIKNSGIKLRVRKMYRPENTHKGELFTQQCDLNMLYYSNEEEIVDFNAVQGKCYISYGHNIEESLTNWIVGGPDRFYFSEIYDASTASFEDVPASAMRFGSPGKCAANSKKNKCKMDGLKTYEMAPKWARITPMRCLDVFAGCGGLSKGLHASGVAQTRWAIEKDGQAALAFRHNNPYTTVFTTDCNALLRDVMQGNHSAGMPRKGEVEMLVGGPPCQGFSGMNRFNAGQYSLFKNSLIVSYLSYCDFYRPNYFILENVRNFVSFKKSLVLKLTLRCLLAMGYQVTFGVVQAGHYGVAQTRRRMIIYAAAPGYELPKYPEPLHVFSKRGCHLSVQVGNKRYTNGTRWLDSAPLRSITVFDAMGDLPAISNGCSAEKMLYLGEAHTHFQRLIRRPGTTISDHMCKDMTPLVEARMSYIPLAPGSDWRDLPNIVVRLSDGTYTNKLRYEHRTKRQLAAGDDAGEAPRGVCQCAVGRAKLVCDPSDRQVNTLIPWCLPHTADRHNHWAGLYGRLEWGGYFSTTVTNPEPMGKQGRVLHPEQHRVVSVRECARSQGFPDSYEFIGTTLDRHRQVGNAVPPPLGLALGREIIKAYLASNR